VVPFKVRRRAQAVRLAAQGWTAPASPHLAAPPQRSGGAKILGRQAPGARPRWTPAMSAFLGELLAGEEAWTAPRLQEALERRFFVTFHPGTVRRKLLEMGYRWVTRKRTF
jgi:transposase